MSLSHLRRRGGAIAVATAALSLAVLSGAGATGTTAQRLSHAVASSAADDATAPGVAVTTTMTDPIDTPGRLDLVSVRHRARELDQDRVRISYQLRTATPYRDGMLEHPQRVLVIELHRQPPRGADRNITVTSEEGRLVATLISNASREPIADIDVHRIDGRTIRVVGPRRLIGARSFFAYSNFHDGGSVACGWHPDGWPITCQDSVPDSGWIRVNPLGWPPVTRGPTS